MTAKTYKSIHKPKNESSAVEKIKKYLEEMITEIGNMKDFYSEIAREIDGNLYKNIEDLLEVELNKTEQLSNDIKNSFNNLFNELFDVRTTIGNSFLSINRFNLSAARYTQDIEILFPKEVIFQQLDKIKFDELPVEFEGYEIIITQAEEPELLWYDNNIKKDSFQVVYTIKFKIGDVIENVWIIKIFLAFIIDQRTGVISLIQINAPRFCKSKDDPSDPISLLPFKSKDTLREKLYENIDKLVKSVKIEIPKIDSDEIKLTITPHTYAIKSTDIIFIDRQRQKRRERFDLAPGLPYGSEYNLMLRIKKEYILEIIKKKISELEEAEHLGIDGEIKFNHNEIELPLKYEDTIVKLGVVVNIKVYMIYKMTIELARGHNAKLLAILNLYWWDYNLDIKPWIEWAYNDARDVVYKKMEEYKRLEYKIADFSNIAIKAEAFIEKNYGLQIFLKVDSIP